MEELVRILVARLPDLLPAFASSDAGWKVKHVEPMRLYHADGDAKNGDPLTENENISAA